MNNTQVTPWIHVADAAVAGLWLAIHPLDAEHVDEGEDGQEDDQPDDDCLDEFHLGSLGGVCCNFGRLAAHEEVRPLNFDGGRNATIHPVLHALDTPLFREAQTACQLGRAAQFGDEFCVGHDVLNAMCSQKSNVVCNNALFSSASFAPMREDENKHPSFDRLLLAVRELDKAASNKTLAGTLLQSDQTITNWGKRGVSLEGALKAQGVFSVSANWVLHGTQPKWIGANSQAPVELTKTLISSESQGDAGYLLLRLMAILGPLDKGVRNAASELIYEAIRAPALAEHHAAKLGDMLGQPSSAPESQPPGGVERRRTPGGMQLPRRQVPDAEFPGPDERRDDQRGT